MNQGELKTLLKQPVATVERQPDCPDDYQLASYMDGGLSERDHHGFEVHIADCAYCIERIGILGRAGESDPVVVERQVQSGKRVLWQQAPRWAAAALVVITVGFIANQQPTNQDLLPTFESPTTEAPDSRVSTERFVEPVSLFPDILSPLEGSSIDRQQMVFEWKDVPGSLFYDIRIVSDDGALITRQRVWGTQWRLPTDTSLTAGSEYFVRVDAFVSEGKAVSSEHTIFRVAGE